MTVGGQHEHGDWEQQLEQLSAYLDSELGENERVTLEQHLSTCEECRQALGELKQTRALLRALPAPELPRSFRLPETGAVPRPMSRGSGTTRTSYSGERVWPARALQWAGGLVAVLGLFILVTTTLTSLRPSVAAGTALPAPAANSSGSTVHASQTQTPFSAPSSGKVPAPTQGSPATQTPTDSHSAAYGASASSNGNRSNPLPLEPIAGAALAIGGAGFFVTGTVLIRRRSRVRRFREPWTPE